MGSPGPGNKKGGGPPPIDFSGAATQTGMQNRPDQTTPFGSMTWTTGPDGRSYQTSTLNPALQGLATGLQGQAASAWGTPLDKGDTARNAAVNSIYGQETSRLDPQWNQQQDQLKAQMANSGLDTGSEAGGKAIDQFNRQKTDAYQTAMNNAITGGTQAAQQQQQLDLTARNSPLSALSSLFNFTQMPGVNPGANYLSAAQAQGNYNLDKQTMDNSAAQSFWKGMSNLGGDATNLLAFI